MKRFYVEWDIGAYEGREEFESEDEAYKFYRDTCCVAQTFSDVVEHHVVMGECEKIVLDKQRKK